MLMKSRRDEDTGLDCQAMFSDCEKYRYDLWWKWGEGRSLVALMLNPSTATHEFLDPTVDGCKRRAEARGLMGVRVVNLFAYRATDPTDMRRAADPIGVENDAMILSVLKWAALTQSPVFAGWGKHGTHLNRDVSVLPLFVAAGLERVYAFDLNQDGSPKHPLYVSRALEPKTYWRRDA